MSNFLDLPPQLRNYIYELVIRSEPVWSLVIAEDLESWRLATLGPLGRRQHLSHHTMHWPARERDLNVICSMAYVCRQIRDEMTSIITALRRPRRNRDAHWSDELSEEADSSSLEIRIPMNYSGSAFVLWNVKFGLLPAKHQVFLVSEGQVNNIVQRNLVTAMGAYMVEKGTGPMVGDFDPERMAALTVAEFQGELTARWSFSLHRRTTECIRRVAGVRHL